jgi:uncharacterized protein
MSTEAGARGELAAFLEDLRPIDHHCHGVVSTELDRPAFEALVNEGFDAPPAGTSHLDSPVGLAIRRWCAPALGLDPLASAEAYLERRVSLGAEEAARRLLGAAKLGGLIVESGYRSSDVVGPARMGELAGARAWEVVRLEAVAEAVAEAGSSAAGYADAFRTALEARTAGAVGLKTIAAYRGGFAFDPAPPSPPEVADAAGRWLAGVGAGPPRVTDPVLLRFGIWAGAELARDAGLPLQVHSGWGDPDLTLHLANPSLLTELVKALGAMGVKVVFLHCYPYHREAAYLATVLPNVSFDVGEALTYLGVSSRRLLAEALELAPFTKQLYSSDAFGVPELHLLGAAQFRRGLADALGGWVEGGDCSMHDAERIARLIAVENATRIYPLERGD